MWRHLVVHVLLPHGGLQGVQQGVHQPLALPQPAPGLGTVGAHVPEEDTLENEAGVPAAGDANISMKVNLFIIYPT